MDNDKPVCAVSIHWLTVTFAFSPKVRPPVIDVKELIDKLPGLEITGEGMPYPKNYKDAFSLNYGVVSWHPEHKRMRICVNLTGTDCDEYRLHGGSLEYLIKACVLAGGKLTRIDAALDYYGKADIPEIVKLWQAGMIKTNASVVIPWSRMVKDQCDISENTTVYIGSEKSERRLCIYDKAHERGILGECTRIEYRTRHTRSLQLARAIVTDGLAIAVRTLIRDYVMIPRDWWGDALKGKVIEVMPVGRKQTERVEWLIDFVLPILEQEIALADPAGATLFWEYWNALLPHAIAYNNLRLKQQARHKDNLTG
jgi:hypothetical protein